MLRRGGGLVVVFLSALVVSPASADDLSDNYPGWLPPGEVSPFFPDDAFSITPDERINDAYLRKSFELAAKPRRAVIALTGQHMISALVNGAVVVEAYNPGVTKVPRFADVTDQLKAGPNVLELRSHSPWSVHVYAQLRMEHADGRFEDIVTDASWRWHRAPVEGWPRGHSPGADWRPVSVVDDYYGTGGKAHGWAKEYALMPRDMLRRRMTEFNDALRASWPADEAAPKSVFRGRYTKPEYAAQYEGILRIDSESGQVVDAAGETRHLFFTIYNQKLATTAPLHLWGFDFDRLEEDLALMEKSGVHPYMRNLGWSSLLDAEGNWQRCERQPVGSDLPKFEYNYEVLDYFLDRCQAHGRFVAIECDFFWAAHWETLPAPYHTRYYLYPEVVEANALAHRKILSRYSDRTCIAGYMIGEEDIIMAYDLENGHLRARFIDYLRSRYGTLAGLRDTWRVGYDFDDRSQWRARDRRAEYWSEKLEDNPVEKVNSPYYPLVEGFWGRISQWPELNLPVWPRFRAAQAPCAELLSHRSYNEFTPMDPVWIDYNTFREDVLYLDFVSRWAGIVREAVPNHLLFHCNAQDFTNQWHFMHFQRRSQLPFDVIGTGSHDSEYNLSEISPWNRMRKYYRIVASYRPHALAPGSPAVGVASGEGAGGKTGNEDEILNYYRAQNFEMVGHGAAFEQSYTWTHLCGANAQPDGKPKFTKVLEWMGDFYRAVDGVKFSLRRPVDVLVVRNNNLQRSNRSGRDYGNALGLIDFLGQLNIEFDIAMDEDLVYGRKERKIDLGNYRMVFLPCIDCDYPEEFWQALDAWISDPAWKGKRALVVGYVGKRTPYLAPTQKFHPVLAEWLGTNDYASTLLLKNEHDFTWRPLAGGRSQRKIKINFGDRADVSPIGVFGPGAMFAGRKQPAGGRPLLLTSDGKVVAVSGTFEENNVYAFGFPLGLNFDMLWPVCAPQEPYDVVASIYEDLIDAEGVPRPIRAPHNIRVAVSDDESVILVAERFGIETTDLCSLDLPEGAKYDGCELVPHQDGRTLIRAKLEPYGGLYLKRVP